MGLIDGVRRMFAPTQLNYILEAQTNVQVLNMDSVALYKTQPNLQAVLTFIADNTAQLPLKAYERTADNDRQRAHDSTAQRLLSHPNPDMTTFELMRSLSLDYDIFGRAVWMVLQDKDAPSGWQIRPIPPTWIVAYEGGDAFAPRSLDIMARGAGGVVRVPAENFIIFSSYHPTSPSGSISPLESLKQTLQEQAEADRYRLAVWKNGGKASSYIVRPKDVQPWTAEAAEAFKRDFKSAWTGNGSNIGGVPVLEDGMEIKTLQFNARESQWAEAKKLSREDVASVYHINPSLIWHTDGQTYASAKDNARALYNDCLAPRLQMIQQRINQFLLPRVESNDRVYVEFELREKLRGSFEEQAQVIQSSVGAPWLTRNEARAMNNLPAVEGGDELITPLNVLMGGIASPTDTGSQNVGLPNELRSAVVESKAFKSSTRIKSAYDEESAAELNEVFAAFFKRQSRSILPKLKAKDEWWDAERWDTELADDLEPVMRRAVGKQGAFFMGQLGAGEFNIDATTNYVRAMAANRASAVNSVTKRRLDHALEVDEGEDEADTPAGVFQMQEDRAEMYGIAAAFAASAFALVESVQQSGRDRSEITKTWIVTSANPRASHAAMDGETVPYDDEFSNGARWPGDIQLDPEESCNCQCQVEINIP